MESKGQDFRDVSIRTDVSTGEVYEKPLGFWPRFRYYEDFMDRKLGIESQSTERVLPEARKPPNQLVMGFMWASATMNLTYLATGFIGNEIGLSLTQSILITIFATLLGSAVTVGSTIPFSLLLVVGCADRSSKWIRC